MTNIPAQDPPVLVKKMLNIKYNVLGNEIKLENWDDAEQKAEQVLTQIRKLKEAMDDKAK